MILLRIVLYVGLAYVLVLFIAGWLYYRRNRALYGHLLPLEYFRQRIRRKGAEPDENHDEELMRWQKVHCTHEHLTDICPSCAAEFAVHLARQGSKRR